MFLMAWMSVAVVLGASRWGTGSVGCGRWAVLGGFLCWFVVGGCWGRWCCRWCFRWFRVCPLVRVSWRPVWALVAVLVWVSWCPVLVLGVAVRVFLGVAVRHSWLRAWWVLLCVLAASGGPAVPLAGCWVPVVWVCVCCVCGAGGACALVCGARLWGSCRWRLWGCVLCARSGVCAVCWWCVGAPALAFAGVVWRPCLVWGLCVVPPPLSRLCGSPPPLAGVCWWCVPLLSLLRVPSSFPCRLGRCRARAFPAVVCGGGSLSPARVPSPGVSPWGSRCLHSPSGCNSVVRMPSMDLFRSQVLQPFPTPGSGTLWVAGGSSRDRRVSCLPRWTVCPTRSPSLGTNRSTCRGECSWSGPLVTPPGRCHRGPLTNGPGRTSPYCVCSGGADTVTGGAPKPLRLGSSPAPPVGPLRPAPLFAVRFAVVGVPSLRGGVVVVGGGGVFAVPGCVACGRVAPSSGRGSPPVCVFVARCVRAWCLCWCVVRGLWCVVCGGGVLVGLWRVCGVVGPSPLLAEVPVCYSPPLLVGFRCRWWWAVLATPG